MRGKAPLSESGSNEILLTDSYDKIYREFFTSSRDFLHRLCKKSPIVVKKCN
jgi:hypothetical protein